MESYQEPSLVENPLEDQDSPVEDALPLPLEPTRYLNTEDGTVHLANKEPPLCWELTTLWVVRLDDGAELKVTDPKEQQGDVEEEEAEGEERRDGVDWGGRRVECC